MNDTMPMISIVAPVHNELLSTLNELVRRISAAVSPITPNYEIILVDDGSENDAWETIQSLATQGYVIGIRLTRNFGQQVAISAGLDYARGDWVVVMDSDLQDRPEVIPQLYAKAREGFDVVFVKRGKRPEPYIYLMLAAIFYRLLNLLSGQEYERLHANFSIISAAVVRAIRRLQEPIRFYGGMLRWAGFKHTSIEAEHGSRFAGQPSFNIRKRIRFAFSLIIGFSTRLLYVSIFLGLLMALASLLIGSSIIIQKLLNPDYSVAGWPSVMTAVFFTAGVTNVAIGFIGIYVGQIIQQTKFRPLYVVAEQTAPHIVEKIRSLPEPLELERPTPGARARTDV